MFDFGGPVLLTPFELRAVGERSMGLHPGALAWTGPFDPQADADWQAFQSGQMREVDYWQRRCDEFHQLTGEPAQMPAFMKHLYSGSAEELTRPEALELIHDAKRAGLRVGLHTNDLTSFHDQDWIDKMAVLREFDCMVEGRTDKVMKPAPEAYLLMVARMGVPAEEIVFIDDQPINLEGARAVGMQTVHLNPVDPQPGFTQARRLLGLSEAAS